MADFIIHPLIALRPRTSADVPPAAEGKQNNAEAAGVSSTTPSSILSSWSIFNPNLQDSFTSLSSSVSNSVSNGWNSLNGIWTLNPFSGLVDTPVRDSTTTSTTTTTTPRPDVVVRLQHRASTRRPLIEIDRNRPNLPNFNEDDDFDEEDDDSEEFDDNEIDAQFDEEDEDDEDSEDDDEDEEDVQQNNADDDDDDDDDDEEEQIVQRPNSRRRPIRNQQKRRINANQQNRKFRPAQQVAAESDEEEEDDDDEEELEQFYYRPSTKRSQPQTSFIQRGQQGIIKQIRQMTRGQSPAEISQLMRKGSNKNRKQATLYVNRNGQTVYMAPELMTSNKKTAKPYVYAVPQTANKKPTFRPGQYPQPPLTVPIRIRGQPTQYISIPWSKLGIAPPTRLVSITEGIQGQPLILNIPQESIQKMQTGHQGPIITADAVPLLAEASLMDIFKPPAIPPSRTSSSSGSKNKKTTASKKKVSSSSSSSTMSQRIRGGTVVEKAPAMPAEQSVAAASSSSSSSSSTMEMKTQKPQTESEFIVIGEDADPGVAVRKVKPVMGDARYFEVSSYKPYFEVLPNGRLALRKVGRSLEPSKEGTAVEQQIPVQIVSEPLDMALKTEETAAATQTVQKVENNSNVELKELQQ